MDFASEHFQYEGARIRPLPVQSPLPLWFGGSSPAAIRRTARFGTGWQAGLESPAEVAPVVAAIKAAAVEAGRPMDPEHFSASFYYRFGALDDPTVEARRATFRKLYPNRDIGKAVVAGGAAEILQRVEEYFAAGITKFVLRPMGETDAEIYDQTRRLVEEVFPVAHRKR